jgi:NodT family efflux transporter outer membrane factor (OMF) lipoprotein
MKKFATSVLAALLLAGCVSAPSTTPGVVALDSAKLGLDGVPAPLVARAWWTSFNDPQLDMLVEKAFSGSPTLAAALARMRMAQSKLSENRAETYPQLNLDAQEMRERFSGTYIIPRPYAGTTRWIGTIQGNLSWDIDFWGRQAAMVDKARASARAAALDADAARLALAGAVAQAYVQLSSAYALCDVAAEAVKDRQDVLALTDTRLRHGLENAASQKQAMALLVQARQSLIAAQSNRDLAVHAIATLIGRGADVYGQIARPRLDLDVALPLPQTLPADLLARRPDILAAQARIEASISGRKVARTAFYPDVNLMGLAGWASIGLSPLFSASSLNYGVGPAIHLPIFDAGKLRAEYASATAQLDLSVADYNAAVLSAVKQTADALTQSRSLAAQLREEHQALAAVEDGSRIAEARYRRGISPQINVLDLQNTLLDARRQQALLDGEAANARVALLLAVGGGFNFKTGNAAHAALPTQDKTQ